MLEKTKKAARSIVMAVLAVLLTLGAVSANQQVLANKTNTGAPGSTTVSSIKNSGGGSFVSDYQGAYFYVVPYTNAIGSSNVLIGSFGNTSIKEGKKTVKYRDVLTNFENYEDYSASELLTWKNQYHVIKQTGYTDVPAQTSNALLFIPYTTHNGSSLQDGWKANISSICYYDYDAGSVKNAY